VLATSILRLIRTLQTVFREQARSVLRWFTFRKLEEGQEPFLGDWTEVLAKTTQPLLMQFWQQGALNSQRRVRRLAPSLPPPERQWSLVQPQVLAAARGATLQFCEETNATATKELGKSLGDLRELLAQGLEKGDAIRYLGKQVQKIFADPYRAYRIAQTEVSRATYGGALLAAQENPAVGGKMWLAGPNACQQCQDLDLVEKPLDKPFIVLPGGGPYAKIMHPPLHPFCLCDMTEVLA